MGLGLGIDYALLMVNRFREELHHGKDVEEAIINTLKTAGKTVFYSGLTVFVTLLSLTFFPLSFLKSFGYAGVSVVALAVAGALFGLPPILAIIGPKVDKGVVRKSAITPKEDGRWAQTARMVMKRPVAVVLLALIMLGLFASPLKKTLHFHKEIPECFLQIIRRQLLPRFKHNAFRGKLEIQLRSLSRMVQANLQKSPATRLNWQELMA